MAIGNTEPNQQNHLGVLQDLYPCCFGIYIYILVGGLEHDFYFPFHIWDGIILLIDEVLFFKMVIAPPTRSEIRCLDSN